jgi:hypothetical protein
VAGGIASSSGQTTYPNYAPTNFQFNTSANVGGYPGSGGQWWGQAGEVDYGWVADDSKGDPNSGSLLVAGVLNPSENDFFMALPFDPTWGYNSTNGVFNLMHYTNIEFDVKWDVADSTVPLSAFNAAGDISGFPIGLMYDGGGTQVTEACGSVGPTIPNAASNGWVHMNAAINQNTPGIDRATGLWFKKYNNGTTTGVAYFYIDNVVFDGAVIPAAPPAPTLTISKATPGVQISFNGAAANPQYDRENIVTGPAGTGYNFVDSSTPVTYSVTYGYFAPSNYAVNGVITIVPTTSTSGSAPDSVVTGLETEPNWNDGTVLQLSVARYTGTDPASAGDSQVVLQYKGQNSTNSNGTLYDASNSNTTWTVASPIEGTWSYTFTGNTTIHVTAPNGMTTNLPFPLSLTSGQVSSQMAGGAYVYFGGQNGPTGEGQRLVMTQASITGSATPLSDTFTSDSAIDTSKFNIATDNGTRTDGVYLLGSDTKYFLDWTINAGAGWQVQTNTTVLPSGFGASSNLTAQATLVADHYHTEVASTNLPSSGNLFFRLSHAP